MRPSQERETSVNSDRGGGDEGDGDEGDGDVVTMAMRVRVMANGVFLTHQVLSVSGPEFASSYRLLRTR